MGLQRENTKHLWPKMGLPGQVLPLIEDIRVSRVGGTQRMLWRRKERWNPFPKRGKTQPLQREEKMRAELGKTNTKKHQTQKINTKKESTSHHKKQQRGSPQNASPSLLKKRSRERPCSRWPRRSWVGDVWFLEKICSCFMPGTLVGFGFFTVSSEKVKTRMDLYVRNRAWGRFCGDFSRSARQRRHQEPSLQYVCWGIPASWTGWPMFF